MKMPRFGRSEQSFALMLVSRIENLFSPMIKYCCITPDRNSLKAEIQMVWTFYGQGSILLWSN